MRPCGLFLLCGAALVSNATSDESASARVPAPRLISPTSPPARPRAPCSCNSSSVESVLDSMTALLEPNLARRLGSRDAAKRMLGRMRARRRPEPPRPQLHGAGRPLPFISRVQPGRATPPLLSLKSRGAIWCSQGSGENVFSDERSPYDILALYKCARPPRRWHRDQRPPPAPHA